MSPNGDLDLIITVDWPLLYEVARKEFELLLFVEHQQRRERTKPYLEFS